MDVKRQMALEIMRMIFPVRRQKAPHPAGGDRPPPGKGVLKRRKHRKAQKLARRRNR